MAEEQTTTVTTTKPADTANSAGRDQAIYRAFLMGWLIVELYHRIKVEFAQSEASNQPSGSKEPSAASNQQNRFGLELASRWRALFCRIAELQQTTFPDGTTKNTLYEPPLDLPYLHPKDGSDYADLGISANSEKGVAILPNFALYGEARRAINVLSLLYVDPEESLLPEVMRGYHKRVIDAALPAAAAAAPDGSTVAPSQPQTDGARRLKATELITDQVVKFLDAWDGFLRENFFNGGVLPNDDLELIAYQAGHSMGTLSWGVSAATVTLENTSPEAGGQPQKDPVDECINAWQNVFREQDIIRLQHQISALSSALDDAYYQKHTELKRPDPVATGVAPNPDLPSEAIRAVKHSIDYWQRTVSWIVDTETKKKDTTADTSHSAKAPWLDLNAWKNMRLALTEQANIWQSLMTGQESLRAFNLESVTRRIMKDVTDRIQSSFHQDFKKSLRQAEDAMKEVAEDVKETVRSASELAKAGLEGLFQSSKSLLIPLFVVLSVAGIALVIAATYGHPSTATLSSLGGTTGIVTAVLGAFHLRNASAMKDQHIFALQEKSQAVAVKLDAATQAVQASSSKQAAADGKSDEGLMGRIQNTAGEVGSALVSSFQKGYDQIRIELASFGRSTAVAYPLIEFFVSNFVNHEEEFLTKVIWNTSDRQEEIQRIISAAFGPLAVFMSGAPKVAEKN